MFHIKIPTPTTEQAFDMLSHQIRHIDWFLTNNRPYRFNHLKKLNNPLINQMISEENRRLSKPDFFNKFFKEFQLTLYHKTHYEEPIRYATEAIRKLQPCYSRFIDLHNSWGFELFETYQLDINLFVCGGSYWRDKNNIGHILCGFDTKADPAYLARTLGHEIVHLGIEDLIINPNHETEDNQKPIQQEEKERIVDNLCIYTMQNLLPLNRKWSDGSLSPYQEVAQKAAYMDKIVGDQPTDNLVTNIKQFLKEKAKF